MVDRKTDSPEFKHKFTGMVDGYVVASSNLYPDVYEGVRGYLFDSDKKLVGSIFNNKTLEIEMVEID